ncbi:MAG: winged helix-turn-helix transcriptional regulator [Actinobacteria bacterium]|nr:winged helix-turn-helix transcriptional regulator [Actinomycetota bacterium]
MANEQVVELGKILGDQTRVALLDALFDGRAYTVTELSRHVGVSASTTSEHLSRLLNADIVSIAAQGRHRYYRLAGPEVASMLETLFGLSDRIPVKRARVPADLQYVRSCYDHLAGRLAVGLTDSMLAKGLLAPSGIGLTVTTLGCETFDSLGVATNASSSKRDVVRPCLDWSERRHHVAGSMPSLLLDHMVDDRWVTRTHGRALWLTDHGRKRLSEVFDLAAP